MTITATPPATTRDLSLRNAGDSPYERTELATTYPRCSDGFGTLTHLFFSEDDVEIARAKAICRACGLADECVSAALERAEPYGVWGGQLIVDGVAVDVKRKRGRPRKNPLPVLVLDEVPIPPHLVA